jgi:hypothetical protein
MKRLLYLLLLLTGFQYSYSQTWHLSVDSVGGLNSQGDTAFQYQSYQLTVYITNHDSAQFNDTIDIITQTNDTALAQDTLIADTFVSIAANNSTSIITTGYVFSPVNFDDGDNIVVVWPQARASHGQGTADSLPIHVYFVSLAASVNDPVQDDIAYYPNPVTDFLFIKNDGSKDFKQVRIYDSSGQIVYQSFNPVKFISVKDWKAGVYYISIDLKNGIEKKFRIIKQ